MEQNADGPPISHSRLSTWLAMVNLPENTTTAILRFTQNGVSPMNAEMLAADGQKSGDSGTGQQTNHGYSTSNTMDTAAPGFTLSHTSLTNLIGVRRELVNLAKLAIKLTTQDFAITDGIRTISEQRINIKRGVSRTLHTMHLVQADGFGWAIDATPVVNGKLSWDWKAVYPVVAAFDMAARKLGCDKNIRWGGAWDRRLSDFHGDVDSIMSAVDEYAKRHPGSDLLDGPHFEWAV